MLRLLGFALLAALAACSKYDEVAGLDGGGGQGGGTGGGGGSSCAVSFDLLRTIYAFATLAPDVTADSYAGPAVVEASTADQLVLAFQQETTSGQRLTSRSQIASTLPLPVLPTGARVWLSQSPLAEGFAFGPWEQTVVVRDREGGSLLLGAAKDMTPPFDDPIAVRSATDGCSEPYQNECFPGSTVTHQDVEIAGDTVVKIADRHQGTVWIDGGAYDVSVFAQRVFGGTRAECFDAFTPYGVSLAVLAQNPAWIIAGLEGGASPPSP